MPHTVRRPSRALVTTATIGTVVALLLATIAIAAASGSNANVDSRASEAVSAHLNLGWLQQIAPPPGAALLLIAGLLAARRGHR